MYNYQRLQDKAYSNDQLIISEYTDGVHTKYKIVYMMTLRNAGVEIEPDILPDDVIDKDGDIVAPADDGGACKLAKNLYRARSTIYELAYCNPWDWFFTGTLSPDKLDRSDLDAYRRKFAKMVRDYNHKHGTSIKYLLVPELHADRTNWHVHGFLQGLPAACLHRFEIGDKMSSYIASKVYAGKPVYSWRTYERSFGWCDLEPVASHDGACKYVTKYISKALDRSVSERGKHLFYASQGLARRRRVHCARISSEMLEYMQKSPQSYRGDYCICLWLDNLDEVRDLL